MEPEEPDVDDMLRKAYREAILKIDSERSAFDRNGETYKAMSSMIEKFQKSLAYLQYKEPR